MLQILLVGAAADSQPLQESAAARDRVSTLLPAVFRRRGSLRSGANLQAFQELAVRSDRLVECGSVDLQLWHGRRVHAVSVLRRLQRRVGGDLQVLRSGTLTGGLVQFIALELETA